MTGLLLIGALSRELRAAPPGVPTLETGVGSARVERALDEIRDLPDHVLHVGYCGGLRAGLAEGDLLLVTEVFGTSDARSPVTPTAIDLLRSALSRLPSRLAQGALVTVPAFVHDPAEKRALAERHQAVACDMESAIVARWCAERGVPWSGVRVVSDTADHPILPSVYGPNGIDLHRFLRGWSHPATPIRAARMLRGVRRADRTLAGALPVALEALRRSDR